MVTPKLFQVHASRGGVLLAMAQREYPLPFDKGEMHQRMSVARAEVVAAAAAMGGHDDLVVHTEESPGFLWVAEEG